MHTQTPRNTHTHHPCAHLPSPLAPCTTLPHPSTHKRHVTHTHTHHPYAYLPSPLAPCSTRTPPPQCTLKHHITHTHTYTAPVPACDHPCPFLVPIPITLSTPTHPLLQLCTMVVMKRYVCGCWLVWLKKGCLCATSSNSASAAGQGADPPADQPAAPHHEVAGPRHRYAGTAAARSKAQFHSEWL